MTQNNVESGALFSTCRNYRYALWREWDRSKPKVMFIGLNPSRADESGNDNTIKKVIKVATHNGYGGLYMLNLFAWIATKPEVLLQVGDPLGDNFYHLLCYGNRCREVVFCWGSFKEAKEQALAVVHAFPKAKCFVHTKDGSPKHPLYCRDESVLVDFDEELFLKRKHYSIPKYPKKCPVTGREFFMEITTPEGNLVPTYGGPFDSYTIPVLDADDDCYLVQRYDHDEGAWKEALETIYRDEK